MLTEKVLHRSERFFRSYTRTKAISLKFLKMRDSLCGVVAGATILQQSPCSGMDSSIMSLLYK